MRNNNVIGKLHNTQFTLRKAFVVKTISWKSYGIDGTIEFIRVAKGERGCGRYYGSIFRASLTG